MAQGAHDLAAPTAGEMELERIADAVVVRAKAARHGEIVAVWESGEVTVEPFGLWTRRTAYGEERPRCEFVMTGREPGRLDVLAKLARAIDADGPKFAPETGAP